MACDYDVVIVGGGIGGLTAGSYLTKAGLRILICEQRAAIGGFLTATPGDHYRLDVRLPCLCSQGVVFPVLEELGLDGRQFLMPAAWQIMTSELQIQLDHFDNIMYKFQAYFPHEIIALREYFSTLKTSIQWLKDLFLPHPLMQTAGQWAGLFARILKTPMLSVKMGWLLSMTTPRFLRCHFTDPELIRILGSLGYPQMPALLHMGMWFLFLEDYWLPSGGLYGFADRLVHYFVAGRGEIMLQTKVRRILVQDGKAYGIELENGNQVTAKHIIAAMDYNTTYQMLLDNVILPAGFLRLLASRSSSESYITLCLAVKGPLMMRQKSQAIHTFWFPQKGLQKGMIISTPSQCDAFHAIPSDHQLIYLSYQCSAAEKPEELRMRLIQAANSLLPGIDKQIVHSELWHPVRYAAEFGAWGGASAGWSLHPSHLLTKGFPGWTSPIKNLYHASQWAYSPGGIPSAMLSARQVSRAILGAGGQGLGARG